MEIKSFTSDQNDVRLDLFLTSCLDVSRNQISDIIKNGNVSIGEKIAKKTGEKIKIGDVVHVKLREAEQSQIVANVDFDVPIIYEDEDIMIVNKPPFLTVHGAPSVKEPTLVDWLKSRGVLLSNLSGDLRSGIVHRIDKETSGALAIAKNNAAHAFLSSQLANRTLGRYYLALIDFPLKEDLLVEKSIARNPKNRLKMAAVENGRAAKSVFCKLLTSEKDDTELIAAKLFSGRTHQIRVHLNTIGRHILGDDLYGFKSQKVRIKRVMLHAYHMYLIHPKSKKQLSVTAPLYDDFEEHLLKNFKKEQINETIAIDNIIKRFSFFN